MRFCTEIEPIYRCKPKSVGLKFSSGSPLRKGIRIEYVSKLLGHASIEETQIYAKIVKEELDKAMEVFNV